MEQKTGVRDCLKTTWLARFFSPTKPTGRTGSDGGCGGKQTVGKGIEVKAPVKAIREGGQVAGPVLSEVERMIGAAETGFEQDFRLYF